MDKKKALYIHIPFCKSKCYYCDFNSRAGIEHLMAPYFKALESEMEMYAPEMKEYTLSTVFIGGGTPSLADPALISALMKSIGQNFSLENNTEVSIESNPGTLSFEKLKTYRESGINRLSVGLQAWQKHLLKDLGRIHTPEDYVENVINAKKAGFVNINADLIFGLPGQTVEDWDETLSNVVSTGVTHVSCYSLKIEEGTELGKQLEEGRITPVDDELDRRMYSLAQEKLATAGFMQYELSNFALPGFECRHNITYWKAKEYLGLGAGAHSYLSGVRFNNTCDIEKYIDSIGKKARPVENLQPIGRSEEMSEFVILGLRLVEGISPSEFKNRFGEDIFELYGIQIENCVKKGLLKVEKELIKLTRTGMDLANTVFLEFL